MQRILELDDAIPHVRLRVRDGRIVDGRANLLEHEVEEQLGRQFTQLVLQLLGEVATDRRERLGARIGGQREWHVRIRDRGVAEDGEIVE